MRLEGKICLTAHRLYAGGVVMKIRMVSALLLSVMVLLLLFSQEAAQAVRQNLQLCALSVVPALFPFFVLSSLFLSCGGAALTALPLPAFAARLLGCSPQGISVFFLSLLGGYPTGPRLIAQLYRQGQLSRQEAEHLLLFANNAGPAFVLGFVGLGQLGSLRSGFLLYLIHAATAALIAVLFRPKQPFFSPRVQPADPPLAEALVGAIAEAGSTMVQICAFVTFFGTVLQLFSQLIRLSHPLVLGVVELTCGILHLDNSRCGFTVACALLGWGGLSVHCQTAAVLSGTGLSLRNHLRGKLLHGIFAAFCGFFVAFLFG